MRTWRYLLVVVVSIVSRLLCFGEVSIETIATVTKAVVPIVCGYNNENNRFILVKIVGSGFFVDNSGGFLTANHVLDDWNRIPGHFCTAAIYIPDKGWKNYGANIDVQSFFFNFTDCVRNYEIDVAFCRPIENPFTSKRVNPKNITFLTFDPSRLPDGTPIAFTGFPLNIVSPITSKGYIAGVEGTPKPSNFAYIIDKPNWPGASGSVVYTNGGKCVGIILQRGLNDASGIGVARSSSAITEFLAPHPTGKERPKKKDNQ